MAENTNLYAFGIAAIGVGFVYSALTGKKFLTVIQGTVKGGNPKNIPVAQQITGTTTVGGIPVPTGSASSLASDALRYQGAGYVWAGAPAKGVGNWDCSSFVNWCAGHDLGLPIPGFPAGSYDGSSHGPPTGLWLLWTGLQGVKGGAAAAEAGDLCIWQTHMGIAIGNGQMISALDESQGTQITQIDKTVPGEALFVRRYANG